MTSPLAYRRSTVAAPTSCSKPKSSQPSCPPRIDANRGGRRRADWVQTRNPLCRSTSRSPGVEFLTTVSSSMSCFPTDCRFARSFDNRGNHRYGTVDQLVYERAAHALDGLCLLPGKVERPQVAFGLAGANTFGAGKRI